MVLHLPGHQKSWFCDYIGSDPDVALLNKSNSLFHGLWKFESAQHNSESSSAKGRYWQFLSLLDAIFVADQTHVVQFLKQLLGGFNSEGIVWRQLF